MSEAIVPAEVFPPGEYLRDELEARGWTETEFAQILGRPVQAVSEIINDRKDITPETALAISDAFGTSPDLWLNLQSAHKLHQARTTSDRDSTVARRAHLRSMLPVRELQNRGWLPEIDEIGHLEAAVCEFLRIGSVEEAPRLAVAARRANRDEDLSPTQIGWLARVDALASELEVGRFDERRLAERATAMATLLRDPFEVRNVAGWLAECGVALVVEFPLRSSKIDGAAFYASSGVPAVALSTRGNRFDSFVFTLLHEIAHLLSGHVRTDRAHLDESIERDSQGREAEANELAASWIFRDGLDIEGPITTSSIVQTAERYRVHPSLVIGRLQWDEKLHWKQFRAHIPRIRTLIGASEA